MEDQVLEGEMNDELWVVFELADEQEAGVDVSLDAVFAEDEYDARKLAEDGFE